MRGVSELKGEVSGEVKVQGLPGGAVELVGELVGLPGGVFGLKLVRGECGAGVGSGSEVARITSDGDGGSVSVSVEHEDHEDGVDAVDEWNLAVDGCVPVETGTDCEVGERVACAPIVWERGLTTEIIIIIVVAIIIFLIIVICIPVLCCWCRKRKAKKQVPATEEDLDSLDDPFLIGGRSKSPMYDELSLPFIDASLPPTPRIGRTVNGLDILLGNDTGSTNSFVDK